VTCRDVCVYVEQYDLYGDIFDHFDKASEEHAKQAEDIGITTWAFVHSVTSPYPRTRYTLGSHAGVPLSVSKLIMPFIPDRDQDDMKMANVRV
jgi:hypothetical protein